MWSIIIYKCGLWTNLKDQRETTYISLFKIYVLQINSTLFIMEIVGDGPTIYWLGSYVFYPRQNFFYIMKQKSDFSFIEHE